MSDEELWCAEVDAGVIHNAGFTGIADRMRALVAEVRCLRDELDLAGEPALFAAPLDLSAFDADGFVEPPARATLTGAGNQ